MAATNFLRFRLDGVEYTLRSDKSPEQMERIVKAVENKIGEIRELAPHYSQSRAATLAALQLSEELMDLREEYGEFVKEAGLPKDTLF